MKVDDSAATIIRCYFYFVFLFYAFFWLNSLSEDLCWNIKGYRYLISLHCIAVHGALNPRYLPFKVVGLWVF